MTMKTSHKTLISGVLILALIIGAAAIIIGAPKPQTASVLFEPGTIDLEAPGSILKEVQVRVWFKGGKNDARDVDPTTLLVDGDLEPKGGWKQVIVERWRDKELRVNTWCLIFKLSAGALRDRLWQKIGHMTPGIVYEVYLEVTGNFIDLTPFAGTGIINALVSVPPNPEPPPG